MDPIAFLRGHPPFDRLDDDAMREVGESLEIAYLPRGARALERGGEPSHFLHVVRKGSVRLERDGRELLSLEEGECFGFPSMIGRSSPHADVVAAEDTLVYKVPERVFTSLMVRSAFAEFFLLDLSARLRKAAQADFAPLGRDLSVTCREVSARAPVFIHADARVRDAARAMRAAGVSSLLVASDPPGIVTDRDLRSRILAEGLGPDAHVAWAMSRPVLALHAGSSLLEALLFMLEHRVHHVPLEEDGKFVGIVTDTDLLKLRVKDPTRLLSRVDQPETLSDYASDLADTVAALAAGGVPAPRIGRIVSRLNDALVARVLRRAEEEVGYPPCPYSWIVFGSEGRMEQTLLTDQDNALVYRDATPEAAAYFGNLARRAVDGLLEASFPPCRGGFMATNWSKPLSEWESMFRRWVETPEPRALVEASNFFDFRAVHGSLGLAPLEAILARSGREPLFLAHLAKCAIEFTPPLGLFRKIREEEGGVDLKRGGLLPIVGLARLHALEAGSPARPTLDRLEAAARAGTISTEAATTLSEAFAFLLDLRLRDQLRARASGEPLGNRARLEALSPLERRHLKDVFLAVREFQEATAMRYAVDRLG